MRLKQIICGLFGAAFAVTGCGALANASDVAPDAPIVEVVDEIDRVTCFYASLGGGFSSYQKLDFAAIPAGLVPTDSGFIDAGIGCQVMDWARLEGELGYRFDSAIKDKGNTFSGKLQSFTGFANLWLEPLDFGTGAKPYIGGGIGFASHKLKAGGFNNDWSTKFAWQVGAGVGFELIENLSIDLGYRFKNLGAPASTGFGDLYAHELRVGLRFRFGGLM